MSRWFHKSATIYDALHPVWDVDADRSSVVLRVPLGADGRGAEADADKLALRIEVVWDEERAARLTVTRRCSEAIVLPLDGGGLRIIEVWDGARGAFDGYS